MNKETKHIITANVIAMCILSMVFYAYEYYLRVVPSVMSTELKQTFLLSEAAFGHLAACYSYAYTPMQIPVGMMMDRFGPRRILTFACFLCAFGTYLFATTPYILVAQLGRFLVGFGSAFAYVGVLKISNEWLPHKYFALMAGLCTTLGSLGAIGGQISLTHLVARLGWQATLYDSVIVGIVLTVVLWLVIRDKKGKGKGNTQYQPTHIYQDLATETHSHSSKIKLSGIKAMISSPQLWITGFIGCLIYIPISGLADVWAISFLQAAGMSKPDAAVGSSMLYLGFAIGAPFWGWFSDKIRNRRYPLILGSFVSAAIMAFAILEPSSSRVWMYSLLFLATFFAGSEILIFAVGNDLSRDSVTATAAAFINMLTMVGGAFVPPVIGKILDNSIQIVDSVPIITAHDYSMALSVIPAALVLSGILSIILKESYRR